MIWTDAHRELLQRFATRYPLIPGEDSCRAWTTQLAHQFRHTFGACWGAKRADPTRPLSKDAIAYQGPEGFWGFDVIAGAGGDSPTLVLDPKPTGLTGQIFVSVLGVDYLAEVPPPDGPPPPPVDDPPPPTPSLEHQIGVIVEHLQILAAKLDAMQETLEDQDLGQTLLVIDRRLTDLPLLIKEQLPPAGIPPWPQYEGRILGFTTTLKPKPVPEPKP